MVDNRIAEIGSRIRQLRLEKGFTLDGLAQKISEQGGEEVHFTTLAKIERSKRTISVDWILRIAAALEVRPEDLMTPSNREPVRLVPVLGSIAAGNWKEAIAQEQGEYIPVPGSAVGPNAFALRPIGDSMNRVVNERTILVVDPDKFELQDGKLYAVMNEDGETTFKRFRSNPMRLEPDSDNPEHQPISIGQQPFRVIGRVEWRMEKMD